MLTLTSAAAITAVALIVPLVIHTLRVPIPEISGQIVVGVIVGPQALRLGRGPTRRRRC